jgi:peptide/nickel transport system permease protein/peptide/nickel transport system substrate-binding protein
MQINTEKQNALLQIALRRRDMLSLLGAGTLMTAGSDATAQRTPLKGGVLRVSSLANPSSLDPMTGGSGVDHIYLYTIFDTLTEFDFETLGAKPGMASWAFPNLNTMVLTLKTGIKFHDGTACDAQAVKFNLDRARTDVRSSVKSDVSNISAVEVTGPLEVKLTLSQPDAALPGIFADRAGMMMSPTAVQKLGNAHDRNPVGCGPWKFVSWADNQSVVVMRNEGYWKPGQPYLDGIEMSIIPELATGLRSVVANQNHLVYGLSPRMTPLLERAKNVTLVRGPSLFHHMIYLNYGRAPLNNVKVRQAINYAIDRRAFVTATMGGIGEIATQNLPSTHWAYDKTLANMYPHDPARVKKLLAEAGFPDGLDITIACWNDQDSARRREVIEAQLAAVGIRCKFTAGTITEVSNQFFGPEKKFDAYLAAWSGRPDPSMTYSSLFGKAAYYNASRLEGSDELATLLQHSRLKEDQGFRTQVFAKIQRQVMELGLNVPIAFNPDLAAVAKDVQGYRPNLLGKPKFNGVWLATK